MCEGNESEAAGKRKAEGSGRPSNAELGSLMRKCAGAFMPDVNKLVEDLERCPNRDALLETARDMVRDLTEYGAVAGAHLLRRAAAGEEDAQVAAVEEAYRGIGAPGDWGYSSPRGKTWHALLQAHNRTLDAREKEAPHACLERCEIGGDAYAASDADADSHGSVHVCAGCAAYPGLGSRRDTGLCAALPPCSPQTRGDGRLVVWKREEASHAR